MIPSEVIYRTYPIGITGPEVNGTAFSITYGNDQYLVTAAHVVEGFVKNAPLYIGRGSILYTASYGSSKDTWQKIESPMQIGVSRSTDIAIFKLPLSLKRENLPLIPSIADLILGQRVHWLGYPLQYNGGLAFQEGGYIGLAASGTLASMAMPAHGDEKLAKNGFIVDGMNNAGYSGSPVIFHPGEDRSKAIQVLGVVSGTLAAHTNWGLMVVGSLEVAVNEILG